ncbi:ASCH domain-containing protein [Virgibacillus sp. MSJ-26]|uniref:ASCH domain-containing protein n=1 Tax=Virgibacillus sp. MSJ-26 TaxID=2841522 RepID=UPI001C120F61|nr:ASCH domain-containing protein [Virgibacillus sp. MSJ-26]MBU5465871.1 ASCH domain-containing protein [Virgibacillus sp. MSJ-26]
MVYENKQDWPEKYDINKLVTRQKDIDKIIKGEKTSERRNDRYADAGDELELDGHTFVVEDVYPQKLKTVTEENAKQEGYDNLEEYKKSLTSIHHGAVWDPEAVVWAHELKEK